MKGLCCRYGQLGVFIVCLFFTACIPEDIELPYRIMSVATGSSMNVTELSVTLSGNVTLIDSENITCGVIYGTSSNLSSSYGAKTLTNANGEFEVKISGLKANTTYYYRAYAVDAGRYKYGEVLSFTTKKNVAVTTGEAVGITTNSVNIKGTVNHAEKSLVCGIVYGTSSELSYKNGTIKSTTSSGDFSVNITGLNANTIYYYCAYVVVNGAYRYGGIRSFRTEQEVTITTNAATYITDSGATLGGTINNSDKSLTCGIIYGTSSSLSSSSGTKKSTTSSGSFSVSLADLSSNTTYYYRAYVIVNDEYRYGDVCSFKTTQKSLSISVTTGSATGITSSGATLSGLIDGADQSLTCGIIYGTSSSLSSSNGTKKSTTSQGNYSLSVTGLEANTTYYYRAYAVVDGEYVYGEVRSFTTNQNVSVTTGSAADITSSGATLSGSIDGADQSLTCGIIYGTSSSLSSSNGTKKSTTSQGSYSLSVTGLDANTTYYYRAYAVVDGESVYGEVRSFTTVSSVTVTSGDAIDLGLSVKWASCNVGAESPEDYGDYFAWGETETKYHYLENNSDTYWLSFSQLKSNGVIDSDGNLTAAYDAAMVNWGKDWRMPTSNEVNELINNCTWEWITQNGVNGFKVTGSNGNSIFLPAAGWRYNTSLNDAGSYGYYWSASHPNNVSGRAYYLYFNSGYCYLDYNGIYKGRTVRPVSNE